MYFLPSLGSWACAAGSCREGAAAVSVPRSEEPAGRGWQVCSLLSLEVWEHRKQAGKRTDGASLSAPSLETEFSPLLLWHKVQFLQNWWFLKGGHSLTFPLWLMMDVYLIEEKVLKTIFNFIPFRKVWNKWHRLNLISSSWPLNMVKWQHFKIVY